MKKKIMSLALCGLMLAFPLASYAGSAYIGDNAPVKQTVTTTQTTTKQPTVVKAPAKSTTPKTNTKPTVGSTVQATLPTFTVTMNGQKINNATREYPFLVYKDITYFPMTHWDCKFLGVNKTWTSENGTIITIDGTSCEYNPTVRATANPSKVNAIISAGKYTVLNNVVNNSAEKYPILAFRDVAYFPLTWDWCQKFGWTSNYNASTGLTITTEKKVQNTPVATPNTITNTNSQPVAQQTTNTSILGTWYIVYVKENGNAQLIDDGKSIYFAPNGTYTFSDLGSGTWQMVPNTPGQYYISPWGLAGGNRNLFAIVSEDSITVVKDQDNGFAFARSPRLPLY